MGILINRYNIKNCQCGKQVMSSKDKKGNEIYYDFKLKDDFNFPTIPHICVMDFKHLRNVIDLKSYKSY